jgi:LPXTG-motif cell wall-anchored protein
MGKPNISGDFQPFMLVYPVEVNRGTHEASEGIKSTVLLSVIALVLVLSVLGGVILLRKKKK